jgi:hypothetical protein
LLNTYPYHLKGAFQNDLGAPVVIFGRVLKQFMSGAERCVGHF